MKKVNLLFSEVKELGLRGLYKKYGWKFVAAVVVYYLIRDTTLYILIPFVLVKYSF